MGIQGVGSSLVIALVAVLWLVYLIPTWHRRRHYLSTERNAVRLQQTIRIMAESAEVPEAVRLEADARTAAHQEKLLRQQYERDEAIARAREAAMERAAARTMASLKPSIASEALLQSPAAVRLRRSRAVTTAVLSLALLVVAASFAPALAAASVAMLASGLTVAAASVAVLAKMASVAKRRRQQAAELRARPEQPRRTSVFEPVAMEEPRQASWTPVPLPKPLYLSKPVPQPVVTDAALAAARQRVLDEQALAEQAERAALAAERAEKVTPIRAPQPVSQADSVYARMGIVGDTGGAVTDLDAVLRRRRAV